MPHTTNGRSAPRFNLMESPSLRHCSCDRMQSNLPLSKVVCVYVTSTHVQTCARTCMHVCQCSCSYMHAHRRASQGHFQSYSLAYTHTKLGVSTHMNMRMRRSTCSHTDTQTHKCTDAHMHVHVHRVHLHTRMRMSIHAQKYQAPPLRANDMTDGLKEWRYVIYW